MMAYDEKGAAMIRLARAGNNAAARAAYLDYVNNFLTVAGFASYYGMTPRSAETYLAYWRELHEGYCAAVKQLESARRDVIESDGDTWARVAYVAAHETVNAMGDE